MSLERLGQQRRVIVMMTDVAQEHRTLRSLREPVRLLQRGRIFRRPPSVEVATLVAAQARPTPTAVDALCWFVVDAPGVYDQPLHEKHCPPADGTLALDRQLLEEFLVTVEGIVGLRSLKCRLDQVSCPLLAIVVASFDCSTSVPP